MAGATVHITGLRELNRSLAIANLGAAKAVKEGLKRAAEPVAQAAKEKVSRYPGASVGTIGPRVGVAGVWVTQRAKKVSGKRSDFGTLQQKHLEASLDEHADEVSNVVEVGLDGLFGSAGL